jgi:hypothetical protein
MQNIDAIIAECLRQEESCQYSSATLFEWLKRLRWWRGFFIIVPLLASGIASWQIFTDGEWWKFVIGVLTLLAGVLPSVYKAMDFDVNLDAVARSANGFKSLQDRFRQARTILGVENQNDLSELFPKLMERMDELRMTSPVAPEKFFEKAQKKIKAGHYDFIADAGGNNTAAR